MAALDEVRFCCYRHLVMFSTKTNIPTTGTSLPDDSQSQSGDIDPKRW